MGKGTPVFEVDSWRIRSDTNDPDGGTPTWETAEDDSSALSWPLDTAFRIRWVMSNTGDADLGGGANHQVLQFSQNGGTFTDIDSDTISNEPVGCDNTAISVGDLGTIATGNFVLSAGTGTASTGTSQWRDGGGNFVDTDLVAGNYTEVEFGITLRTAVSTPAAAGDTFTFRLFDETTGGPGTINYTNVPTVTVPAAEVIGPDRWGGFDDPLPSGLTKYDIVDFRRREDGLIVPAWLCKSNTRRLPSRFLTTPSVLNR